MRLIKVAIANVSTTVGAVTSNMDRMLEQARLIAREDVTLAGFPEQATGGYPLEDLVQWRAFVAAQRAEIERFAAETARAPIWHATPPASPRCSAARSSSGCRPARACWTTTS